MQAGCVHCGQQHLLNDSVLAKHAKVQFRCTKCGKTTIVEVKRRADETVVISPMPSFARADVAVIGRKGADFALNDPEVSRHHCQLEVRESFVNLKDLDSTNGTFFDGERVRAAVLQDGAEFRVGSTTIRLRFHSK
jgi:ribosomal protein S27AE